MTDFDTDMLREERLPVPVQAEKDPLRDAPKLLPTDPALVAAMEAKTHAEPPAPAAEPARAAPPDVRAVAVEERKPEPAQPAERPEPLAAKHPEALAEAARRQGEARRRTAADATKAQESSAAAARQSRERLLTRALAGLLQAPETVRLDPLVQGYAEASPGEVAAAADAIVALYLRAEPDLRRRLRPALAAAVRRDPAAPLALALSARLGALAMPAAAPPPPPPAPDP